MQCPLFSKITKIQCKTMDPISRLISQVFQTCKTRLTIIILV